MRKVILAVLAIAAVAIVAAGITLTSRIRAISSDLARQIAAETGLQVTSSGLPGISFWPRFAVSLGNVVIPAAKDAAPTPLATVETLRIVPAGGLFGWGEQGVLEVTLERPSINLVVNREGRANWTYGGIAKGEASTGLPVRISQGTITFLDERSGKTARLTPVDSQVTLAGPTDEFTAKGSFVWNERPAAFTLFLKSPQRMMEDGSPADITLQAPGLAFQFSGRTALAKAFELDGQAEIKSTDLGLAASWFGTHLPQGITGARFELAGPVEASSQGLSFTKAQFVLDDMRGEGDVAMALGKGRPAILARVAAQTIDLTRYGGDSAAPALLENSWPSEKIDFSALRTVDADLDMSVQAFTKGAFRTGPARLAVKLHDGALDMKLVQAAYGDGKVDLALAVDSKAEPPVVQFSANGDDLLADKAMMAAVGFSGLSGKLSPSLAVSATGHTLAELVSTLKGQASLRIVSGSIRTVDLSSLFGRVANAVVEGWGRDERIGTAFDALSATFLISDGIAETSNLALTSPVLSLTGKGEVDLLRQAVDLKVDPRFAVAPAASPSPQFTTFPVAVQVKGPWSGPKIYPDMPGILDDPASAYAALKKLGLGGPD